MFGFIDPWGGYLSQITYPDDPRFLLVWLIVALSAVCLAILKRLWSVVWVIPVGLLLLAYPIAVIIWNGDAMEIGRHSLQVGIQLRLGLWLLLIFAADALLVGVKRAKG
ncbi:MAG: hypothetical protein IVW55_05825 [Chloroflexi bacterium]|nr:hypothetical protein [Chloroflexota bacterium]